MPLGYPAVVPSKEILDHFVSQDPNNTSIVSISLCSQVAASHGVSGEVDQVSEWLKPEW